MTAAVDRLTWDQLAELEPRLRALEAEVRAFADGYAKRRVRCANAVMLGFGSFDGRGIKDRLQRLVGWYRPDRHPVLSSALAYDLAGDRLYRLLPDCRGCNCF